MAVTAGISNASMFAHRGGVAVYFGTIEGSEGKQVVCLAYLAKTTSATASCHDNAAKQRRRKATER